MVSKTLFVKGSAFESLKVLSISIINHPATKRGGSSYAMQVSGFSVSISRPLPFESAQGHSSPQTRLPAPVRLSLLGRRAGLKRS